MPLVALLIGLGALVCYVHTAGPTFHWLDSSEFVAASFTLGVSHPPGHALHALLSHLFCMLPVGTIAFRVTLASAVEAAAATTVTAMLCWQVLGYVPRRKGERWIGPMGVVTVALFLALSHALWLQAVRAEVYALNLLVVVSGASLALRWERTRDRRFLLLAAGVCGLGLGNHHLLVLLALPAVLVFLLVSRVGGGARTMSALVLSGSLGLCILAYLPLRAMRHPLVNWGVPSTLQRIKWVVTAEAFQKSVSRGASESLEHRTLGGLFTVMRGFAWDSLLGLAIGVMALVGLGLLWRRRATRRVALLLSLLVLFNLLSVVLVGLDPYNPDAYGYLCVAVACLCPGAAVALHALGGGLIRVMRGAAPVVGGVACVGLVLWQVGRNLPGVDLRRSWAAEATARQQLALLPSRTLLLSSYFESVFNLWALRAMSDVRPDVDLLHRNFISYPGYEEQVSRRMPALAPLVRRWATRPSTMPGDLERLQRPVRVEYDLNLPANLIPRLQPAGLTLGFPGAVPAGDHRRAIRRWERWVLPEIEDNEARRAMVWTHFMLAHFCCATGRHDLLRYHLGRARRLAPRDRTLLDLDRRCVVAKPVRSVIGFPRLEISPRQGND